MEQRSIGIDCRLGGIAHAGIGRYISELVKRLVTADTSTRWVLFCADLEQATELLGNQKLRNVSVVLAPAKQYTFSEQFSLPKIFSDAKIDLLHVPHFNIPLFYNKPIVVTIHDLLWHEYTGSEVTTLPPFLYWPKYLAYRFLTAIAVNRARCIFVPTQTVKKIILKYYPKASNKISVTKEGIGSTLLKLAETKRSVPRKTKNILYVGSLYPHKNVSVVLQALRELPEYTLDIVGSRSVFQKKITQQVAELGIGKQVVFRGRLSDGELAQTYLLATAVIQPSLSEGFGLTGLEALAFKTPVLASDIPIFHEVYQDAALYFNPHSPQACIEAIKSLEDATLQKKLRSASAIVVSHYSWDTLVTQTLAGYAKALE